MGGMSCGGKCGMIFLIILNTLFFLFGLALLIIGIVFIVDTDTLQKTEVLAVLDDVGFSGSLSMGNVMESLPIFTICVGVIIIIISGLGVFGACCKVRCMLITYAIIVILIVIIQCVCIALWITMKDRIDNTIKDELTTVLDKYEGYASTVTDEKSSGWNLLFIGLDCCGVDAATAANDEFSGTVWAVSRGMDKIPASCCTSATEDTYPSYTEPACTQSYTNYRTKGCYDAFDELLGNYQTAAIVFCAILIVTEIVAVIFACIICREVKKMSEIV